MSKSGATPVDLRLPTFTTSMETAFPDINNGAGVALSNPKFGHERRKMLDLVNKLHSTGVQVDIDLPQIAVIGSQSAGKSSLIESISGITLPRAAGTCTRCPTECKLARSSGPWQCTVSLQFTVDSNGQPLGQARNQFFGGIIYEKSQVEDRIRRAQLAILNPEKPAEFFLGDDDLSGLVSQLSFSKNCVTLQIRGPDVADLSFCDLPGLIASQSSSRGGKNDIGLVQSLVSAYIQKPSCIILLTVACETDFENQGAHRLTKEHDPEGKRTIGVLTKPDRIPTGEESNWISFIRNEREPLDNNWFCVKQPSSNDLKSNITWEQARQMENDFFTSQSPWSDLEGIYQKYLRTGNLVERLSNILSDLIAKRLPQIQAELEKSIMRTSNDLGRLPKKPLDDPRNEISSLIHTFTIDLGKHVQGLPQVIGALDCTSNPERGLIQSVNAVQQNFRVAIRSTAPNFQPFEKYDSENKSLSFASFLRSEEGDDFGDQATNSDDEAGDQTPSHIFHDRNDMPESPQPKIHIDEVLVAARSARTRELPGHYPFVVQVEFIQAVVAKWQGPAMLLCRTVHKLVLDHVQKLVSDHFSYFGQGYLETRVSYILLLHMKRCHEQAEERIKWLIELEKSPFSLNTHYLADYRAKFLAHYRGAREGSTNDDLAQSIQTFKRNGLKEPTGVAKILSSLAEIGLVGIKAEDLPKLLPPDPMEPALGIMADVRAYFQVAYKRFVDTVPLAIDYELVRGAARGILEILNTKLGINSNDGYRICQELAQESFSVADRRKELEKKLERLERASSELMSLGM